MQVFLRQPIVGLTNDQGGQITLLLETTIELPCIPCPGLAIRGLRESEKVVTVKQSEFDIRSSQCRCTLEAIGNPYVPAQDTRSDFGPNWHLAHP